MKYISTRDAKGIERGFEEVIDAGLAPDKGLYIPKEIPLQTPEELKSWSELGFKDLAVKVMSIFIEDSDIPAAHLKNLVEKSYSSTAGWTDNKVTPLKIVGDVAVLEQFHGPTCAFKDVALQFVGNLFEYFLERKNANLKCGEKRFFKTVLGATSGDTGGAAIFGLRGKKDVKVCILHPENKIAKVQEWQMTSVIHDDVHNVAIDGNFDNCQDIVKKLFAQRKDDSALNSINLGAVNSINWARILAQIVYYFSGYYQWLKLDKTRKYGDKVSFVVPSGNFGNALAGHYARRLGLPIETMIVATNSNDILHRCIKTGEYSKKECTATLAPAMDISAASNFERYLYELAGGGEKLAEWMAKIDKPKGSLTLTPEQTKKMKELFKSEMATDDEIRKAQKDQDEKAKYMHCPHTAVGIHVVTNKLPPGAYIVMATAHHGKFGETLEEAKKKEPALPKQLENLEGVMRRMWKAPNNSDVIRKILIEHVQPVEQPQSVASSFREPLIFGTALLVGAAISGMFFGLVGRKK